MILNANSHILIRIKYSIKTPCQRKKESVTGYRSTVTNALTLLVLEAPWIRPCITSFILVLNLNKLSNLAVYIDTLETSEMQNIGLCHISEDPPAAECRMSLLCLSGIVGNLSKKSGGASPVNDRWFSLNCILYFDIFIYRNNFTRHLVNNW